MEDEKFTPNDCAESPDALLPEQEQTKKRLMYPAVGCALLGALAIGTVIGYPAMAVRSMVQADVLSIRNIAEFNSIMAIAALPGAFVAGIITNRLGRRNSLKMAAFLFTWGWLKIIFPNLFRHGVLAGRFLTGFATGMACVAAPVYIVEIAPRNKRGFLGGLFGGVISAGILLNGVLGGLMFDWHGLAICNALLTIVMTIGLYFIPESPKFLVSKERLNEAMVALRTLHGSRVDVQFEVLYMRNQSKDDQPKLTTSDLLNKSTLKAGFIVVCLMLFQSFSGMNAMMMYAVAIFQDAAPSLNATHCTIMLQAVQFTINMFASSITNKFGRRLPLMFSAFLMCISLAGFAFYQYLDTDRMPFIAVICCMGAVIGFAVGYGPLPWLVAAEIAPTKTAGFISALATSTNWASFFVLIYTYDSLVRTLSLYNVFWMYSGCCLLALLFTVFCLPETAGKSNQEIEFMLEGRRNDSQNLTLETPWTDSRQMEAEERQFPY